MPLAGEFPESATADWVREKDAQWDRTDLGRLGGLDRRRLRGLGGYQREPAGADFALVLARSDGAFPSVVNWDGR
jgi:hypothetical protein